MERMLVGVDGSPAGHDVLGWAVDLSGRAGLDLVAARVFEQTQAELPPEEDETLHRRQKDELDGWCADAAGGSKAPRTLLADGAPPDALLEAARSEQADLLAVGARGAGGFVHLHLGSVAHHLAHHTTLPRAIVPRTGAAPVARVVVGVDGSPTSLAALAFAAELAARVGAPITAVHAFDPGLGRLTTRDGTEWRRQAEEEVRGWTEEVVGAGMPVDVVVEYDEHPVRAIGGALESAPGSIAVVGARGLGGVSPPPLVHHTGATTVLVPPPTTD